MKDAGLSFRERTHQFLKMERVPRVSFTLVVELPETIQLENPLPFPFRVHIVVNRRESHPGILAEDLAPLKFRIKALQLVLHAHTEAIAPGRRTPTYRSHDKRKHHFVVFPSDNPASAVVSITSYYLSKIKTRKRKEVDKDSELKQATDATQHLEKKRRKGDDKVDFTKVVSKDPSPLDMEHPAVVVDDGKYASMIQPISSEFESMKQRTSPGYEEERNWTSTREHSNQHMKIEQHCPPYDCDQDISTPNEERPHSPVLANDDRLTHFKERHSYDVAEQKLAPPSTAGDKGSLSHTDKDMPALRDHHIAPTSAPVGKNNECFYIAETGSSPFEEETCTSSSRSSVTQTTPHDLAQKMPFLLVNWDDEEHETIDIGALFDLCVGRHGLMQSKTRLYSGDMSGKGPDTIYPSFKTWSIKHSHAFKYKMTIEIGGKNVKFVGESGVNVIGPTAC